MPRAQAGPSVAEGHAALAQRLQQLLTFLFMGMRFIEGEALVRKGLHIALFHLLIGCAGLFQWDVLHRADYNL